MGNRVIFLNIDAHQGWDMSVAIMMEERRTGMEWVPWVVYFYSTRV
ncbi:hypothetical protein [Siminovitchia acidinfaciens]|nr:hypothetical protein [Siminovitchia acidinfaciens]